MADENIRMLINQLNRMEVDKADYEYIVSILRKAIKGVRVQLNSNSTELYFRARIYNEGKPYKIDEIKAPPTELVKGFQRCNRPGMSMFYCASHRITALLECNVKEGDKVYLGQWLGKVPAPVNMVMSSSDLYEHFYSELTPRENTFYTYIDTIFTRPVHETFSNVYKFTAAATEVITTNYQANKKFFIGEDCTVGILYPSVANIENSHNFAFHSKFANERFVPLHVMELLVKSRTDKNISVEILDNAIEFPEGNIEWLNDPYAVPKLKDGGNGLQLISNGRSWIIPIRDTKPTYQDINDLLNEKTNLLF